MVENPNSTIAAAFNSCHDNVPENLKKTFISLGEKEAVAIKFTRRLQITDKLTFNNKNIQIIIQIGPVG